MSKSKRGSTVRLQPLSKADVKACRDIIREGSKSFYFASLILPKKVRSAALALYSFCRVADDLVDAAGATQHTLDQLRMRLEAAYGGQPFPHVADRALADVVARYDIPQDIWLAMIEGFEWDLLGKRYETYSDVLDYSARVAATVGVMMPLVMRRRSSRTLARAADLGVAMQLTNIARDVGEDAAAGRLYLPRTWLAEEGVDADTFLANPVFSPALGRVTQRLLREAERLYSRALTGVADLPLACRPSIRAAGLVYSDIGASVQANGFNSVSSRAYTTKERKLALLLQAFAGALYSPACDEAPPLAETAFLVACAADHKPAAVGGIERFMDLLHMQHHRQRSIGSPGGVREPDRQDTQSQVGFRSA
ncbi:MAG: phytoene/squalene synthase family protein [Sphingomonadales bacterium]